MGLPQNIIDILLNADGKALATTSDAGINVVPVSTIKIVDGKIWLINYFLGKTLENINRNSSVALACWKGLEGYQIKGKIEYVTYGRDFEQAREWIAEILPERFVKGLLIITPTAVYDVSAAVERAGKQII